MTGRPPPDGARPFFLTTARGNRFCLEHAPPAGRPDVGAVVFVHPFAEELNKVRRMAALQSRALAARGHRVLQIDLLGCGDSSGEFGDATLEAWVDDVVSACAWLRTRTTAPLWLWGARAGCLVANGAAHRLGSDIAGLLFWQPVVQGKALLQQFLRLKAAAAMREGSAREALDTLRQALARGDTVDVAGYPLAPGLASGLERADLAPPASDGRLCWFEVSPTPDATLSPAGQAAIARWGAAGWRTEAHLVAGPMFWQTTEVEVADSLIPATLSAIGGH